MALRRGAKFIPSLLREIAFRALQNCAARRCQRRRSALSVIAMDTIIESVASSCIGKTDKAAIDGQYASVCALAADYACALPANELLQSCEVIAAALVKYTPVVRDGLEIFNIGGCVSCHACPS
jgi:hypothetical protein